MVNAHDGDSQDCYLHEYSCYSALFSSDVVGKEQVPQLKPLLQSQIYCSRGGQQFSKMYPHSSWGLFPELFEHGGQWGTDVQLHDFFVTSNIQTDDPAEERGYSVSNLREL